MPKRLNHFQIHPKKKPKKLPHRIPTKEQIRLCIIAINEMSRLARTVGFKFNDKIIRLWEK